MSSIYSNQRYHEVNLGKGPNYSVCFLDRLVVQLIRKRKDTLNEPLPQTDFPKLSRSEKYFFKLEITSRERPKSALYLRLKIVKRGPFGLCETPVGCKIGKN